MSPATGKWYAGAIVFARGTPYYDAVVEDGPLAYWRLGESSGITAVDAMGLVNGTYVGSPTLGATGSLLDGDTDTAVAFNGASSQAVPVGSSGTLDGVTGDITVECLAKFTGSGVMVLVAKYDNAGADENGYLLLTDVGGVQFDGRDGNATYHSSGNSGAINDGAWHHVVGQREGSVWRIFVDGAEASSDDVGTSGSISVGNSLRIGQNTDTVGGAGPFYFTGSLDEVAVYDFALSDARILLHAQLAGYA